MWIKYDKITIKVNYIELKEENGKFNIQSIFDKYTVILGSYTKKKATEVYNEIQKCLKENTNFYEMP